MRTLLTASIATVAGFIGGMIGARTMMPDEGHRTIRATGFELVDKSGQVISYWGEDLGHNVVLAFGARGFARDGERPNSSPGGITNPHNQLAAFGLIGDDSPELKMLGADGRRRVTLTLSHHAKPTLFLADETGPRVSLGIEQSDTPGPEDHDWTLAFHPERARIGMFTQTVKSGEKRVFGGLMVSRDNGASHPVQPIPKPTVHDPPPPR